MPGSYSIPEVTPFTLADTDSGAQRGFRRKQGGVLEGNNLSACIVIPQDVVSIVTFDVLFFN